MPIQFRCSACQQLLGIAKRKAGSFVDCPTCAKKVKVPLTSTVEEYVEPPVRRDRTQPVSIFDRVDVDKLLQKPTKPELVESAGSQAVAVAPPATVRRKVIINPDPLAEQAEEPQAMPRIGNVEQEPLDDEPFALTSVPTLTPARASNNKMWFSIYLALGGLAVLGAFVAGHWVGAHRPMF